MATAGFPWQAESTVREPTYLDEKAASAAAAAAPPPPLSEKKQPDALNNITNNVHAPTHTSSKRCSTSSHTFHHGKRRADSLKAAQNAPRASIKPPVIPRAQGPRGGPTQLPVRTLPAWIQDAEEGDIDDIDPSYLDAPDVAFLAQHNHSPSTTRRSGGYTDYRAHPTSSGDWRPERTSRWVSFGRASVYPRENFNNEKVEPKWLNEHFTDYSQPWLANHSEDGDEEDMSRYRAFRKKRQTWYKRFQFTILRNPFIPLAFRLTVIIFACTAIGLGVTIYRETNKIRACLSQAPGSRTRACRERVGNDRVDYYQDPSALMAIIVDVVSVVYTSYITYDEYFSKPLGLRKARAKVRLVLLDLFFIVFQAANLSLSFESLTVDEGACAVGDEPSTYMRFDKVCSRQQSLSGVLLVSLVAWLLTFSVSVLRLVERIV